MLLYKKKLTRETSLFFISFAIGSLLGAAFFELLPDALRIAGIKKSVFIFVIVGIALFFLLERFLRWYHCHEQECDLHVISSTVLIGDTIHNFLDGIAIAASFMVGGKAAGVATTIAIFFHEVPQEIGDFGVLMHAGYSRLKIFLYNLASAIATPLGAIASFFVLPYFTSIMPYLLAFTSGVFIYIATSDLLPEVHHKTKPQEFSHVLVIFMGLAVIFLIGIFVPE